MRVANVVERAGAVARRVAGVVRGLSGAARSRYGVKLALAVVLVAGLVAATGVVAQERVGETLREQTRENLETDARLQSAQIGSWFASTRQATAAAAESPEFRGRPTPSSADRLSLLTSREHIAAAYIVNRTDGRVVLSSGNSTLVSGASMSGVAVVTWRTAVEDADGVFTSRAREVGRSGEFDRGGNGVVFAARVAGTDRLLLVVADLDSLSRDLIADQPRGEVVVIDERATVAMSRNTSRILEPTNTFRTNATAAGYELVSTPRGRLAIGYAPVEGLPWTVVVQVPAEEAFAVQRGVQRLLALVVGVLLVGLVALGAWVRQSAVVPARRLSERARTVADGELRVGIESGRADEFGQMFQSLAEMRDTLQWEQVSLQRQRAEAESQRERLNEAAEEYADALERVAAGDLTVRLDTEGHDDAVRRIGAAVNTALSDIETTVADARSFAGRVAGATRETAAATDDIRDSGRQVASSIQSIATGADEQDGKLDAIRSELEQVSATAEETAANAREVAENAEATAERGREGRAAASDAVDRLDAIRAETTAAAERVEDLTEATRAVVEVADTLEDIADETERLALNANIEASRASGGDGGARSAAGFGVVAEEIKELAQEAAAEAKRIDDLTGDITTRAETLADDIGASAEEVDEQVAAVETTVTALEEIGDLAVETSEGVEDIADAAGSQAEATEEVVSMAEEVAEISRETVAESREAAAAAEEQASATDEVSEAADDLAAAAEDLTEELSAFDIGRAAAPDDGSSSVAQTLSFLDDDTDTADVVDRELADGGDAGALDGGGGADGDGGGADAGGGGRVEGGTDGDGDDDDLPDY